MHAHIITKTIQWDNRYMTIFSCNEWTPKPRNQLPNSEAFMEADYIQESVKLAANSPAANSSFIYAYNQ